MERKALEKEIQYRSARRGMKELDLLYNRFVPKDLSSYSMEELTGLRDLLLEPDALVWSWLRQGRDVPAHIDSTWFKKLNEALDGAA